MAGMEVEELRPVAPPFTQVVVGEIVECEPHPNADRLSVCRVQAGRSRAMARCRSCAARRTHVRVCARRWRWSARGCPLATTASRSTSGLGLPEVFASRRVAIEQETEALQARLYQEIGQLKVELDWLKRKTRAGLLRRSGR